MGQEIPKNATTGHDDKQDILVLQTSASACHNIFRRLTSKHLSLPPDPDPANPTIHLVTNHASPAESGRHQAIQNVTTKLSHFLFRVGSNGKKISAFFRSLTSIKVKKPAPKRVFEEKAALEGL